MRRLKTTIYYWVPLGLYMGMMWQLSARPIGPNVLFDIPFFDKGIHAVEYAIFAYLFTRALCAGKPQSAVSFIYVVLAAVAWGGLDEVHQSMVPSRVASWQDLIADSVGAVLGYVVYSRVRIRVKEKRARMWWLTRIVKTGLTAVVITIILLPVALDRLIVRARMYEQRYQWSSAERLFQTAVRLMPFSAAAHEAYGDFLGRVSKARVYPQRYIDKAREHYTAALASNPWNEECALKLGMLPGNSAEQMMDYFKRAVGLDPNGSATAYTIGTAGMRMWDSLDQQQRTFVLERLAYALRELPQKCAYTYPLVWNTTQSRAIIEDITPATAFGHEQLLNYIASNPTLCLSMYTQQQERVREYRLRERPLEVLTQENQRKEYLRDLRKSGTEGEWVGLSADGRHNYRNGQMYWAGTMDVVISLAGSAREIALTAWAQPANGIYPFMVVSVDGISVGQAIVDNEQPRVFHFSIPSKSSRTVVSVTYVNDSSEEYRGKRQDRNLFIGSVKTVSIAPIPGEVSQ